MPSSHIVFEKKQRRRSDPSLATAWNLATTMIVENSGDGFFGLKIHFSIYFYLKPPNNPHTNYHKPPNNPKTPQII
jgi:hypothetical protein